MFVIIQLSSSYKAIKNERTSKEDGKKEKKSDPNPHLQLNYCNTLISFIWLQNLRFNRFFVLFPYLAEL